MSDLIPFAVYTLGPALLAEVVILIILMALGIREGFGRYIIGVIGFIFIPAMLFAWIFVMEYFDPGTILILFVWFLYLPLEFLVSLLGLFLAKKLFLIFREILQNREKERCDHAQD